MRAEYERAEQNLQGDSEGAKRARSLIQSAGRVVEAYLTERPFDTAAIAKGLQEANDACTMFPGGIERKTYQRLVTKEILKRIPIQDAGSAYIE